MEENLSATPLRAPKRGGRSITVLVVNDVLGYMEEELDLARVIVDDFVKRDDYGYNKYNQNLESHDGRPTIWDLYQELLDATQYNRKLIEEQKMPESMAAVYPTLLELTRITRNAILIEKEREDAIDWDVPEESEDDRFKSLIKRARAIAQELPEPDEG